MCVDGGYVVCDGRIHDVDAAVGIGGHAGQIAWCAVRATVVWRSKVMTDLVAEDQNRLKMRYNTVL